MIYLIDHEDSFTYNLAHLLDSIEPTFVSNYYDINTVKLEKSSTIVLSPGPGEPKDYPKTTKIYKKYKGKKKILEGWTLAVAEYDTCVQIYMFL